MDHTQPGARAAAQPTDAPSASADRPAPAHQRPPGVSDTTVKALGALSEALETTERARGHLYSFHQLTGGADLKLGEAVDLLREAGHEEAADRLERDLVGRNVLPGRWTFQIVEQYDDDYYRTFKDAEEHLRGELVGGRRHLFEAEMKETRRTPGAPGHEARPAD
ncbi:hypothetical protein QNO07_12185 [Streptomyces sp. 549]|uniref:hypothetical protein n=1 Tax=Streptomyces sp. 549 TaxID=3049076 RepID=UPI0024C33F51|nr:hypothetical protein [Streptomyces sp. 549]MDK1474165.1 hypothetical protein [Streptomyces sp. 549]